MAVLQGHLSVLPFLLLGLKLKNSVIKINLFHFITARTSFICK